MGDVVARLAEHVARGAHQLELGSLQDAVAAPARGAIALADLDNDGDFDLVRVTPVGLDWLENDGGGTFSVHTTDILLTDPQAVAAIDLDRDSFADVVVASADGLGWVYDLALVRTPTWTLIAENAALTSCRTPAVTFNGPVQVR